jgi:hypothetical protein
MVLAGLLMLEEGAKENPKKRELNEAEDVAGMIDK